MKYLVFFLILLAAEAHASCYGLTGDERNYCMAKSGNVSSNCERIKDSILRASCLGEVKNDENYCDKIQNYNERKNCLAGATSDKNQCYSINDSTLRKKCLNNLR